MKYFKLSLETGKKHSIGRIVVVRAGDIIEAYGISKKFRKARCMSVTPITHEEYMQGVSKKYD
jgi:hypothetical protein